jgi:hypothetical protein
MQETVSWISLSNGLTTLTTTTSPSTCPFTWQKIRINVEIFFTKTRRLKKAKRQKQFSKKIKKKKLKSGKKSYQKNKKIKKQLPKKIKNKLKTCSQKNS